MKWELKEDSAAYKYLKLNCKPEIFERRRMWIELTAENNLIVEREWMNVELEVSAKDSVSGYPFTVKAYAEDFR